MNNETRSDILKLFPKNFYQVYEVINFLETIYIQYLILSPEANYILKLYLLLAIRL